MWRTPAFLWLWAARSVSLTGSAVTLVVLPILVFQRTGSPLQTSLLTLLERAAAPGPGGVPPHRPTTCGAGRDRPPPPRRHR